LVSGAAVIALLAASAQAATPTPTVPAGQVPVQPQIAPRPGLQYKQPQVRPPRPGTLEARLRSRARIQGAVDAGGLRWRCKGSRCSAPGDNASVTVAACRALAARVGAVTGFGRRAGKRLSAGALKLCNTQLGGTPPHSLNAAPGATRFGDGTHGTRPPTAARQVIRPYRSSGGAPAEAAAPAEKRAPSTLQHRDRAKATPQRGGFVPPSAVPPVVPPGGFVAGKAAIPTDDRRLVTTAMLRFDGGHTTTITRRLVTTGRLRFDGGADTGPLVVRRATASTLRFTGTATR
jgi:hypothetical protein